MPTDDTIDEVGIRVVADLSQLRTGLTRAVTIANQQLRRANLTLHPTIDDASIRAASQRLTTQFQRQGPLTVRTLAIADTSPARRALAALQKRHDGHRIEYRAIADTSAARRRLADLRSVGRPITIRANALSASAERSMIRLRQSVATVPRSITVRGTAVTAPITAQLTGVQRQVRSINSTPIRIRGSIAGQLASSVAGRSAIGGLTSGAIGQAAIAGGLGAAGAVAGVALPVAGGGKVAFDGLRQINQLRKYQATLRSILRDQREANDLFKQLQQLNIELPTVGLDVIAESAVKLAGSEFVPSAIAGDVRTILDAAATSTAGLADGAKRIATILSQIRSKGKLQAEELLQFSELGLPVQSLLSRRFGGQTAQSIAEQTQQGKLSVDVVIRELLAGLKAERGGALAEQSKLLGAQFDRLGNSYRRLSREVAEPIFDPLSESLRNLNSAIESGPIDGLTEALRSVTSETGDFIRRFNTISELAARGIRSPQVTTAIGTGVSLAGRAAVTAGEVSGRISRGIDSIDDLAPGTGEFLRGLGRQLPRLLPGGNIVSAKLTGDDIGRRIDAAGRLLDASRAIETSTSEPQPTPPEPTPLDLEPVTTAIAEIVRRRFSAASSLAAGVGRQGIATGSRLIRRAESAAGVETGELPEFFRNALQTARFNQTESQVRNELGPLLRRLGTSIELSQGRNGTIDGRIRQITENFNRQQRVTTTKASQLGAAIQSRIESAREIEEQQRQTTLLQQLDRKLSDILEASNTTADNTGRRVTAVVGR